MFFDHVYITSAGYDILAQATAGSTPGESNQAEIVWENAITSNIPITNMSASQINALTPSSFPSSSYTSSGAVTSVSYNRRELPVGSGVYHDVATITVMMKNDQYNGSANTLCIFGKLKNDSTSKLIIVAGADDPQQVPSGDPYEAIIDCHIELNMSAVNSVAADSSWYASADAFQSLENRAVTKYKNISGGSYVGEDQDIYGVKTFKTNTIHDGNILPSSNTLNIGEDSANGKWGTVYATTFDGNATNALLAEQLYKTISLGSSTYTGTVNYTYTQSGTTYYTYWACEGFKPSKLYITGYQDGSGIKFSDNVTSTSYSMIVGETHGTTSTDLRQNYYVDSTLKGTIQTTCSSSGELVTNSRVGRLTDSTDKWSLGTAVSELKEIHTKELYGDVKLSTLCSINGLLFDGGGAYFYSCTCSTGSSTLTKVVACSGFSLQKDRLIAVAFTNSNSLTGIYLNVNNSGGKLVVGDTSWSANSTVFFRYDGTYWNVLKVSSYSYTNYATCSSSDSNANKTATVVGVPFRLSTGARIAVWFNYKNTASNPTLNINGTGAKSIKRSTVYTTANINWAAGSVIDFIYDGTYWLMADGSVASLALDKDGELSSSTNTRRALLLKSSVTNDTISTIYLSDIIANALRGHGGTSGPTLSSGSIGTLGLFLYSGTLSGTANEYLLVPGSSLHRFTMSMYNSSGAWSFDDSTITIGKNGSDRSLRIINYSLTSGRSGTWCVLNNIGTSNQYVYVVLAVRVY